MKFRSIVASLAAGATVAVPVAVLTAQPAAAVCGVANSKHSKGPFWADGKKIDPGKSAPCGSHSFHTGCRYKGYVTTRSTGTVVAFGCAPKTLGTSFTGSLITVR